MECKMIKKDLTGQKFGYLTVLSVDIPTKYGYKWKCLCDCGKQVSVLGTNLTTHNTLSCGCLQKKYAKKTHLQHGDNPHSNPSRLYRCWADMRTRTKNKKYKGAKYYSSRGVECCEEWETYLNFKEWALNNGYNDELTLDRINVNGNYCPENCRWTTRKEQNRNKRNTLKYNGVPIAQLCEDFNIKYATLMQRVYRAVSRGHTKNSVFKKAFSNNK